LFLKKVKKKIPSTIIRRIHISTHGQHQSYNLAIPWRHDEITNTANQTQDGIPNALLKVD
jgi:hypothetical protein